jgi:hypothetical protein
MTDARTGPVEHDDGISAFEAQLDAPQTCSRF